MDLMMPGMSGVEVLIKIRRTPRLSHLPVVMVSAKNQSDVKAAYTKLQQQDKWHGQPHGMFSADECFGGRELTHDDTGRFSGLGFTFFNNMEPLMLLAPEERMVRIVND